MTKPAYTAGPVDGSLLDVTVGGALRTEKTDSEHDLLWSEMIAGGARVTEEQLAAREATLDTHDPINIQFTSGTTGNPKGATLTHHNVVNNGAAIAGVLGYTTAD